jgi:hypothetical protein
MIQRPDDNRAELYGSPIGDLLDEEDDLDQELAAGEADRELSTLPGWVRVVILITVASMVLSAAWWIWSL